MSKIRIGISGWTYAPWRGTFYPKGVTQKKELEYASRRFSSIEINGTFYSLQRPESYQSWADQTPEDFVFAVKAPQFITHVLRLKSAQEPLATFLASGIFKLGGKLGPILWQMPPNVMLKDDRFEKFFRLLPQSTERAAEIAQGHSPKLAGRVCLDPTGNYPMRHAFEFRHPSFKNPEFLAMMRELGIGVVIADRSAKSPGIEDITSDFLYIRMHGEGYKHGYPDSELKRWSERISVWAKGKQPDDAELCLQAEPKKRPRDLYVYFSTEAKDYSPKNALRLLSFSTPKAK